MRAFKAENFRALCGEYGISAKTGYTWMNASGKVDWGVWPINRGVPEAMRENSAKK